LAKLLSSAREKIHRPRVFYERSVPYSAIAAARVGGASMGNEVGAHVGSARKFLINSWVQINLGNGAAAGAHRIPVFVVETLS
jgi:hypothetical protein